LRDLLECREEGMKWPSAVAHARYLAMWEAEIGWIVVGGQSRQKVRYLISTNGWAPWHAPVIPATQEAQIGFLVHAGPGKNVRSYAEITKAKRAGGPSGRSSPSKHEFNPQYLPKNKKPAGVVGGKA
jgi:hypothetical protein